ncbi:hypothetical protein [Roseibacillus persicicus]|uniref:hypothetical protein n=1 Tax=Roseibacillus persicicus TaxID=454148 RepID=UPI0016760D15|nr:hypothetical protein [Roseibacillus persicicus]
MNFRKSQRVGRRLACVAALVVWSSGLWAQEPSLAEEEGEVIPDLSNWPALPTWSIEELELIRSGELELGTDLFREDVGGVSYADLFDPLPEPENIPEIPLEDEYPIVIGEEFLAPYFAGRPAGYLVDPQGMLSMQEQKDRQSFLEYHAGDSQIDLYIYLFDEKQVVPPEGEMEAIFKRHYQRGSGLSALVYYYMGDPSRSTMVMSPQVYSVVPSTAVKGALIYAKQQAQTKSEPASQLESFSTGLSIRLYWMERELAEASGNGALLSDASQDELIVVKADEEVVASVARETKALAIFGLLSFAVLVVGLWLAHRKAQRKKIHLFPEVEVKPLLSAPHAAGVGAVIHFANATLPPSVQKEQVPDYLRKM